MSNNIQKDIPVVSVGFPDAASVLQSFIPSYHAASSIQIQRTCNFLYLNKIEDTCRQTNIYTDKHIHKDRHTDTQPDRHTDRHTDTQIDKHRHTEIDTQTDKHRHTGSDSCEQTNAMQIHIYI